MWIPSVNAIWVRAGSSCAGSVALATNALSTSDLRCRTGSGRADVAAGRQAFVVCPLVEGSERVVATAATTE